VSHIWDPLNRTAEDAHFNDIDDVSAALCLLKHQLRMHVLNSAKCQRPHRQAGPSCVASSSQYTLNIANEIGKLDINTPKHNLLLAWAGVE
jgi:hypothetical protein